MIRGGVILNNPRCIKLRSIMLDDYTEVLEWSKDRAFCLANGWEMNREEKELQQWWTHCVTNKTPDFIRLGIEDSNRLIGYVDLACIKENTAEFGIAIGNSDVWGKGLGSQAALCLFELASAKLGITQFTAETHEENLRSRKLLQKLGFQEVSRIESEQYLGKESVLIQYKRN